MFQVFSLGLGVLIAVMITVNSRLAELIGNIPGSIIVHISGLALVSLIVIITTIGGKSRRRGTGNRGKIPPYLFLGGVCGVGLVLFNNLCFINLGASLTIAMGLLGQTMAGQVVDVTGFLGMDRHPFRRWKLIGWGLVIAGALVMAGEFSGNTGYLALAFIAGAMVMLAGVLNAQLASRIGLFRGTSVNYIMGLLTLVIISLLLKSGVDNYRTIGEINPVFLLGGGFLGVIATTGMNFVLPKIPTVYSSLLIFSGQVAAGLIIDFFLFGVFSTAKVIGAVLILMGLAAKSYVDYRMDLVSV